MTKYRADKAREAMTTLELIQRAYEAEEERVRQQIPPTADVIVRERGRLPAPVIPRPEDMLRRAYEYNDRAGQASHCFGRPQDVRQEFQRVAESADARKPRSDLPPETPFGQAGLPPPTEKGQRGLPRWCRSDPDLTREQAYDAVFEYGYQCFVQLTRRGMIGGPASDKVRPEMAESAAPVSSAAVQSPNAILVRERSDVFVAPPQPELTNVNFAYEPGRSAFEQYAAGAMSAAGRGADFVDPEGTKTFFGRPALATTSA